MKHIKNTDEYNQDKIAEITNNAIYLLCTDSSGIKDSLDVDNYADNEEDLKNMLIKAHVEYGENIIPDSIKINFKHLVITYSYNYFDDEDISNGSVGFFLIKKFK